MATSGSQDFSLNVADAIEEAYERIGQEVRTGYDAQKARRSLNILFQEWTNRGIKLWTVTKVTDTVTESTEEYTMNAYDLDILEAAVRRDSVDYRLQRIGREDYLNIPNKTQEGRPTMIYVERSTTPKYYLWPTPENSTDQIVSYRMQRIEDADKLINDLAIPSRFIPPMVSGLAFYLSLKLAPERAQGLKLLYEEDFKRAADEDRERSSFWAIPKVSR